MEWSAKSMMNVISDEEVKSKEFSPAMKFKETFLVRGKNG